MSDKDSGDKQPWLVPVIVAVVGAVSTVAVAWINKPQPSPSPASTTSPSPTVTASSPVTSSILASPPSPASANIINFRSADNSTVLNPIFKWSQGNLSNTYTILQNSGLEIVGSKGTDHWEGKYSAPLIIYPTKGNFEAQVKMLFDPISNIQAAGLGVRSSVESNTFIRIALGLDPSYGGKRVSVGANTKGVGERLGSSVYTDEIIWMKIKRQDDVITLSYSRNG